MASVGQNVFISDSARIGVNVRIGHNVCIHANVILEDGCKVLDGAVLGRLPERAGIMNRPLTPPGPLRIGGETIIGANAVLYAGSTLRSRVLIGDLASIREGCHIEDDVIIGRGALVMYDTRVDARTRVIDGAILTGNMTIEADVFIGPGVVTINDDDVYLKRFGLAPFSVLGPTIRRFALIGAGANLAAGVEIGLGAIVAPSAMVTKDVAPWTVVAGVPARVIRQVDVADRNRLLAHFGLKPALKPDELEDRNPQAA